jgi:hypothetical protein
VVQEILTVRFTLTSNDPNHMSVRGVVEGVPAQGYGHLNSAKVTYVKWSDLWGENGEVKIINS